MPETMDPCCLQLETSAATVILSRFLLEPAGYAWRLNKLAGWDRGGAAGVGQAT